MIGWWEGSGEWDNEESRKILEFQDERAELLLPRGGRYGRQQKEFGLMPLIPIGQATLLLVKGPTWR